MNPSVKQYIDDNTSWKEEIIALREIVLASGLQEAYKWRNPCYTKNGKNIVLIGATKESCNLSFFKGALLKDSKKLLNNIGENTRLAKLIPFKSIKEINSNKIFLSAYIKESIEVEEQGLKLGEEKNRLPKFPMELLQVFTNEPKFEIAFKNLTQGRQRGYLLHFNSAKQSNTRAKRILKFRDRIYIGKGMLDCVCGQSKRMPNCDGSHKYLNS